LKIGSRGEHATVNIKLLIADVDGTLVTKSKVITARTREALARLREAGVMFTITSGRPPRGLAGLIEPLGLTAPMAAFNGGVYVKPDLTTVIAQHTLSPAVAAEAVEFLRNAGLDVWVYRGADWFLRDDSAPHVAREARNVGFSPRVVPDLAPTLEGAIKIVGVSDDLPLVTRCEAELGSRIASDATVLRSQPFYLDITHPEANKGMVVREAARLLHLRLDEIATIGDMLNDVPMLRIAGMGIAMGNANAEVHGFSRHVTRSNEEEGFAHAVETFILGAPPISETPLGLPPRTRACLFGLEGVLTQTAQIRAQAWKQLIDHHLRRRAQSSGEPFVPFDPVYEYSRHFHGERLMDDLQSFLASRGLELTESTRRALIDRQGEILIELLRHERVETFEGSLRFVRAARAAGLRTAVIAATDHCEEVLASAGIADLFDVRIDRAFADVNHLGEAPAPDTYLAAAQALGVDPEDAALFDDEITDIRAGRAGHLGYIVGVDRVGQASELRHHGADTVVTDLAALLQPDAVAYEDASPAV
jgi:Cof subfamily protein (haloacid dehalogenase superfamily)/HAD superfamily hydrolase (TIGR01509 family)